MIPIAIKLFMAGALKRLSGVFGLIGRYPWQAAVIALCGLAGVLWHVIGNRNDTIAAKDAQIAQIMRASEANHTAQIAQVKALEAKSETIAKEAEHEHQIAIADSHSAIDRYAASHRLPAQNLCRSAASAASQGNNPGVPPEMPSDPSMVAITRDDLQALGEWVAFGVTAHNNAVAKIEAGTAKVGDRAIPDPAFGN